MSQQISLSVEGELPDQGADVVSKVLDPEIDRFSEWFSQKEHSSGPIISFEKEILRSYLWWKLKVDSEE